MQSVNLKLLLLFLATASGVMGNKKKEIVSEQSTSPTEIPYMVSLRTNGKHFCGGSIISHYHILTAAHCFNQRMYPYVFVPGQSYVTTGASMKNYNGTKHTVKYYQIHPYFKMDPAYLMKYDIAIVTVDKKIEMNEHQKIIRMPVNPLPAKSAGIAAGWGDIYLGHTRGFDMLLKLKNSVMNGEECHKYRPHDSDTKSIVCAVVEAGYGGGTCQGDSGGPLIVGNTLEGVVEGSLCASGKPDVYTSVYFYKPWIEQSLNATGFPGVTKDTPESDFYDEKKEKKLSLKYVRVLESEPGASNVAFYTFKNGGWYVVLY